MKVLMINSVCGIGSTGRICVDLVESLVDEGIESYIAFGRNEYETQRFGTYKISSKLDNLFHVLETRLFDNHGFSSRRATYKFISYIKEIKPDVIHLHNLHGYYLNIEILFDFLANEFEGKIIWTLHDCWAFSGHSAFIDSAHFQGSYSLIKEYPKTFFLNFYKRNLKRKKKAIMKLASDKMKIVTPSEWLTNMCKDTYLSKFDILTINNGVNQSTFKYENTEKKPNDKKIILGVANIWDERKGLKVINQVAEKLSSEEYEIVVVGKIATKDEISSKIRHIEQTSDIEELAEIYNSATVFINPTYQDNFPTTNLEALSCGVPVVTFDTGGSGEVVESEMLGRVVKQGDIKGLIAAIEESKDGSNSNEIAKYAQKYSKKKMIEKYITLIKQDS